MGFFAACWAISISPGAGAVAAMTAGLNHGVRQGLRMVAGLILGIWSQLLIVGVGLGALVAASPLLFEAIRWLGVGYLLYLGIAQWRAPARPLVAMDTAPTSSRSLVMKGWGVNTLNPKGTVFLLAVVPQFLALDQALAPQYVVIGLTLAFTDWVVMTGYVMLAAKVLGALRDPAHVRAINRVFGTLFVLAATALALIHH